MKKILYLAAGNPITPSVGMDLVVCQHIQELAEASDLDVTVVAVAPGIESRAVPGHYQQGRLSIQLFVGDLLHENKGITRLLEKIQLIVRRAVPVMAYSFKSRQAGSVIQKLLQENRYDVVLLDHYYSLSNVSIGDLNRSAAKLVYLSHDAMFQHIGEMAGMKAGWVAKIYYSFEAIRTHFVERILFKRASKIIHLSQYECDQIKDGGDKHIALLPPICSKDAMDVPSTVTNPEFERSVIFIGSPGHPPNAHAIDWIVEQFAPVLARIAPAVQIALIGGGTDKLPIRAPNVKGYGFVSSSVMKQMLGSCICSISPVVRGHGIKIKVLDAIAAGCPVVATEESLRGFEQFGLPASIDVSNPEALAQLILKMSNSEELRQSERSNMRQLWAKFLSQRSGQLAQVLRLIA